MDKKDLYNSLNQHLESIDDSLKTIAWALSQSDDNLEDDTNEVPEDALVFSNDIKREQDGE